MFQWAQDGKCNPSSIWKYLLFVAHWIITETNYQKRVSKNDERQVQW